MGGSLRSGLTPPAGCHIGSKFPMHRPSPQPSWTLPHLRLPFRSGLTPPRTAISQFDVSTIIKVRICSFAISFPEILFKIIYIVLIDIVTHLQIVNSIILYCSYMQLQIHILTYQHINISTHRRIYIVNYKHIDI